MVSDSLGREISAYVDHLRVERGLSVNTLAAYGRDLDRYASWLRAQDVLTPQAVTGDTLWWDQNCNGIQSAATARCTYPPPMAQ